MTAHTHSAHAHRVRRANRLEYAFYFVLILVISIPTALLRSVFTGDAGEHQKFFVTEAWSMAQRVTPQIFSA